MMTIASPYAAQTVFMLGRSVRSSIEILNSHDRRVRSDCTHQPAQVRFALNIPQMLQGHRKPVRQIDMRLGQTAGGKLLDGVPMPSPERDIERLLGPKALTVPVAGEQ